MGFGSYEYPVSARVPYTDESTHEKAYSIAELELPLQLARDQLWTLQAGRTQLEFVVDNETLAKIGNGLAQVHNPFFRAPLDRIRMRLRQLFRFFEYKGELFNPIDWRPQEFNTAADHVRTVCSRRAGVDALGPLTGVAAQRGAREACRHAGKLKLSVGTWN